MKTSSLTIFSDEAMQHVRGRPGRSGKPPIYGMLTFARIVSGITTDADADNPFADSALLQVEAAIERCQTELDAVAVRLQPLERTAKELSRRFSNPLADGDSQELPLNFASPYGFMGAHLLKDFDDLVCLADRCTICGLLSNRERARSVKRATRALRSVYHCVSAYKSFNVTRGDFQPPNKNALAAQAQLGPVDASILNQEIRPKYRPSFDKQSDKDSRSNPLAIVRQ